MVEKNKIYHGNNLDILKTFEDNSIDSIVTDPPYGLGKEPNALEVLQSWITTGYHEVKGKGFMGKEWDAFVPQPNFWRECLRVLKPGGHLLSFAGTRTYDWVVMGLRIAGFEIRDQIAWVYGSGFPKSHDISKAIDKRGDNNLTVDDVSNAIKHARLKRNFTIKYCDEKYCNGSTNWSWYEGRKDGARYPDYDTFSKMCIEFPELTIYKEKIKEVERDIVGRYQNDMGGFGGERLGNKGGDITVPSTDKAKQWQGWGTALKPALEPIVMARKPLDGTVAQNVLKYGVGGINIDGCRVELNGEEQPTGSGGAVRNSSTEHNWGYVGNGGNKTHELGRFPANLVLGYLEDEYILKENISKENKKKVLEWLNENA